MLPLFRVRESLTLAVNEPANVFLIEEVGRLTRCRILVVCATAKDIKATLENHLPSANVFVIDEIFDEQEAGELSLVEQKQSSQEQHFRFRKNILSYFLLFQE